MKRFITAGFLAGLALSGPVAADLVIGFVDPRPVLAAASETKANKQHTEAMEKFVKEKQAALKKEDDSLRALGQSLEKEMALLSDAQKDQKQKDFQQKLVTLRNKAKDAEQEAMKKDAEFKQALESEIRRIVDEVAREQKVNLVLNRAEVFYTDTGVDLTEKVVKKLQVSMQKLETKDAGKKK